MVHPGQLLFCSASSASHCAMNGVLARQKRQLYRITPKCKSTKQVVAGFDASFFPFYYFPFCVGPGILWCSPPRLDDAGVCVGSGPLGLRRALCMQNLISELLFAAKRAVSLPRGTVWASLARLPPTVVLRHEYETLKGVSALCNPSPDFCLCSINRDHSRRADS
jgi:hypothetical protein